MPDTPVPAATPVHELPGRLRVRVAARQGDRAYFREVRETFDLCRDVLAADGNPRTASILIRHETTNTAVWEFAKARGLFIPADVADAAPRVLDRVVADTRQIDGWFKTRSGGDLDLSTLVTMALVGMSAYQLYCGQILAPSVTLAWYAASQVQRRPSGGAGPA